MHRIIRAVMLLSLLWGPAGGLPALAQAPVAGEGPPPVRLSEKQLEDLVGRIALYPDDLVAIVLPAATFPLQIVQADRFLQKLKNEPKLQPDAHWDQSVRSLLNYPEVVAMMSRDLDWTQDLGEAVVSQQADVLKAVQTFRARVYNAGNLKTDDKQIIIKEKETIKVVPANPEVIYVPQYQPSTVVVYSAAPVYAYYPTPYPVYYYPYPAGAVFATGFFFGAATAWACNWNHGHVDYNVNVNRTDNLNINRDNPQYQQRADQARQQAQQRGDQARQQGQQRADQARQSAQQRGDQARQQAQQRGGDLQGGGAQWQSQKRPGEVSGGRTPTRTAESRPGYSSGGISRGDDFGNAGRGSEAMRDSSRGLQSRSGSGASPSGGGYRGSGGSGSGSGGYRSSGGASPSSGGYRSGGSSYSGGGGAPRGGGGGGFPRGGGGGGRGGRR